MLCEPTGPIVHDESDLRASLHLASSSSTFSHHQLCRNPSAFASAPNLTRISALWLVESMVEPYYIRWDSVKYYKQIGAELNGLALI